MNLSLIKQLIHVTEISYGGSLEEWEMLCHSKSLTIEKSDLSVYTPRITFLNLNKKKGGEDSEI